MTTVTWSNGNLTATTIGMRSSTGVSSGKRYFEVTIGASNSPLNLVVGVCDSSYIPPTTIYGNSKARAYGGNGEKTYPRATYGATYIQNDTISLLLDLDNGTIEFWKNGVSQGVNSTDIKTLTSPIYALVSSGSSSAHTYIANFGATPFKYPIPSGYKPYQGRISLNKILLLSNNKEKTIHYEENSVPDMVSATSPYGEVKASQQGGSPAWRAFSSTLNGINNGWRTSSGISNTRNQWISYTFPHPVKIDSYSMRGGGGGVGNSIMPKDFRFEGSNDEIVWHVLDEQAEVLASNDDTSWKTYKIHSSEKYKAYRIYSIVNNGQDNYTGISNIMFNGVDAYITDIPSQSEQSFINHGMTQSDLASIDLSADFTEKHYNQDEFTPLGEGKVFEQALDVDKVIKKLVVK